MYFAQEMISWYVVPDIFVLRIVTITIALIFSHSKLIKTREIFDKDVLRRIDYVYLSTAVIGLAGASDFSYQSYRSELKTIVDVFARNLEEIGSNVEQEMRNICVNEKRSDECLNLYAALLQIKFSAVQVTINPTYRDTLGHYYQVRKLLGGCQYKRNVIDWNCASLAATEIPKRIDRYIFEPISKNLWSSASTKVIGYLLVSSSLALRIARVTVELKKWHR